MSHGLRSRRALLAAAALLPVSRLLTASAPAQAQSIGRLELDGAAARLRTGGWVLMMRHAQTEPGIGDPPGFRLDRCATQRNLSEAGRRQARAAGEALRAAGIVPSLVRSSAWCRCRETAELAFGQYEPWPPLDSFFEDRAREPAQTAQVLAFARELRAPANAVLVTHQVNVVAALGVSPAQGEIVAGRWEDGGMRAMFVFRPA
ncbi:histidine phosphatase family protein [Quisquiliibacterium transsilvanicum]|uniref:Phosphohistidine phosphatase SixA n=1 Tax=Quisquiliibacterium transsilvanicum TaxID=1549638 RepID=A0A7W8HH59_9BURK|nr:histidine phosphatase family protein [Quisquiliibacterium transsilvanicum]MBB5271833.1 phosphohistidine phosphatase SixA [Quisquiliibacterium transsilvanicum]